MYLKGPQGTSEGPRVGPQEDLKEPCKASEGKNGRMDRHMEITLYIPQEIIPFGAAVLHQIIKQSQKKSHKVSDSLGKALWSLLGPQGALD